MKNLIIELPFKGSAKTYFKDNGKIAYSDFDNFKDYQEYYPDKQLKEVTQEEFNKLNNEFWDSDWQEITKEEFWDLLECLPPERWHDIAENLNMFFCREASAYSFHACCVHDRSTDKYYQARKDIFLKDEQILNSFLAR